MAQDLWQAHYQIIVNNLSEGIHKIKCIYGHDDKKCEPCGITYTNFEDDLVEHKCLYYKKNYGQV